MISHFCKYIPLNPTHCSFQSVPVVRQSGGIPCGYHRLPDFLHDCSAAAQMGPLGSQTLKRSMVAKPSRNNCWVYKIQFKLLSTARYPVSSLFMWLGYWPVWSLHINSNPIKTHEEGACPANDKQTQEPKHTTSIRVRKSRRYWKPHYALCSLQRAAGVAWLSYLAPVKML